MGSQRGEQVRRDELGSLLRGWRSARGKSQLGLALEADVSQRHLSFIESGRSAPSRRKLLDIAEALEVPLRERNALLLAAGYAPAYAEGGWDEPQMRSITVAVERMLRQQEPFPAVLMDRYWNVVRANDATPRFFGRFIDVAARTGPRNLLHLMFDPAGMRPFIRDWEQVSASLVARVRREAVGRILDDGTRALLVALQAYPGGFGRGPQPAAGIMPMVPLSFEKDGLVLSYFSIVSTVGAPTSAFSQELRVECLFPADAGTEERHLAFMGLD